MMLETLPRQGGRNKRVRRLARDRRGRHSPGPRWYSSRGALEAAGEGATTSCAAAGSADRAAVTNTARRTDGRAT